MKWWCESVVSLQLPNLQRTHDAILLFPSGVGAEGGLALVSPGVYFIADLPEDSTPLVSCKTARSCQAGAMIKSWSVRPGTKVSARIRVHCSILFPTIRLSAAYSPGRRTENRTNLASTRCFLIVSGLAGKRRPSCEARADGAHSHEALDTGHRDPFGSTVTYTKDGHSTVSVLLQALTSRGYGYGHDHAVFSVPHFLIFSYYAGGRK